MGFCFSILYRDRQSSQCMPSSRLMNYWKYSIPHQTTFLSQKIEQSCHWRKFLLQLKKLQAFSKWPLLIQRNAHSLSSSRMERFDCIEEYFFRAVFNIGVNQQGNISLWCFSIISGNRKATRFRESEPHSWISARFHLQCHRLRRKKPGCASQMFFVSTQAFHSFISQKRSTSSAVANWLRTLIHSQTFGYL